VSHGDARTTVHRRLRIVQPYRQGWPQAHIAAAMGISRRCVAKWVARYATQGLAGLADRSSRPHHSPTRVSDQVEASVVELRRRERRGRYWIAAELGIPARTVSRILTDTRCRAWRCWTRSPANRSGAPRASDVRYERDRPGELVHMDVKKLGRIPAGGGWRADGPVITNHRSRGSNTGVGYDYIHSLIDDHSRLAYFEILPDEKGATYDGFLTRAIAYFAAPGITRIERLMTDNAWTYRSHLPALCNELGITQKFIRSHCPWQNGKVERLNRTLATEWAYRQVFTSNDQRAQALPPWLEYYNTQRRHTALGGKPPTSRLPPT